MVEVPDTSQGRARDQDVMSYSAFYGDLSLAVSCLLASKVRHR